MHFSEHFLNPRLGPCALARAPSAQEVGHGQQFVEPPVLARGLGRRAVEGDDADPAHGAVGVGPDGGRLAVAGEDARRAGRRVRGGHSPAHPAPALKGKHIFEPVPQELRSPRSPHPLARGVDEPGPGQAQNPGMGLGGAHTEIRRKAGIGLPLAAVRGQLEQNRDILFCPRPARQRPRPQPGGTAPQARRPLTRAPPSASL